jgi:inner membrane protein
VLIVAAASVLPDADYPKSWIGHQLGSVSEDLNRLFGHRSFLHSLLALVLITAILGLLSWWLTGSAAAMVAVFVGYGSHLLADMMTLGGVQLFWPSRLIATSTASSPVATPSASSSPSRSCLLCSSIP